MAKHRDQIIDCIDRCEAIHDFAFIVPLNYSTNGAHEWIWEFIRTAEPDGFMGKNTQENTLFFMFLLAAFDNDPEFFA